MTTGSEFDAGVRQIGHAGHGFAFDNEGPAHRVFLEAFRIASRLVTNGEYLEFIEDGGYRRPELWLSNGWATVRDSGWQAPLYWERKPRRRVARVHAGRHGAARSRRSRCAT